MPPTALVPDAEFARVDIGRAFPAAPRSMRRAQLEHRAALLVLSTEGDSVTHWLRTGEALSAVLLECTAAGPATCALTHIAELPTTRGLLAGPHPPPGITAGADPRRHRTRRREHDAADSAATGHGNLHRHRLPLIPRDPYRRSTAGTVASG
ncbi:hypothetical protein [Nocardia asiatica]|uniref:hypothetical protein n=1 Tax=Nocardia asiatica TaxID=209252 RepID=UPI00030E62D3|nr:hypothetical protein [Nocardia asiatica]